VQSDKTPGTEQHSFAVKKIFLGSLLGPWIYGLIQWRSAGAVVMSLNILYCWQFTTVYFSLSAVPFSVSSSVSRGDFLPVGKITSRLTDVQCTDFLMYGLI